MRQVVHWRRWGWSNSILLGSRPELLHHCYIATHFQIILILSTILYQYPGESARINTLLHISRSLHYYIYKSLSRVLLFCYISLSLKYYINKKNFLTSDHWQCFLPWDSSIFTIYQWATLIILPPTNCLLIFIFVWHCHIVADHHRPPFHQVLRRRSYQSCIQYNLVFIIGIDYAAFVILSVSRYQRKALCLWPKAQNSPAILKLKM